MWRDIAEKQIRWDGKWMRSFSPDNPTGVVKGSPETYRGLHAGRVFAGEQAAEALELRDSASQRGETDPCAPPYGYLPRAAAGARNPSPSQAVTSFTIEDW